MNLPGEHTPPLILVGAQYGQIARIGASHDIVKNARAFYWANSTDRAF